MSVKSKPYYWIACDHEGCDRTCPPQGDETSAWADDSTAEMVAEESGWFVGTKHDHLAHMCPEHKVEHCERCQAHIGPLAGEQDHLCDACAPAPSRVAADRLAAAIHAKP